jgi:hypothetical protein
LFNSCVLGSRIPDQDSLTNNSIQVTMDGIFVKAP